jgi:hypothetical protein
VDRRVACSSGSRLGAIWVERRAFRCVSGYTERNRLKLGRYRALVVIPVDSGRNHVASAVALARARACQDVEIIGVKDGFTDNVVTEEAIAPYRVRFRYLYNMNGAVANALNPSPRCGGGSPI